MAGAYKRSMHKAHVQAQPTGQAQQAHTPGSRAGQSIAPQHQATGAQAGREAGHTTRPGSRTHPAATQAARTAQGGQGTKASSTPASDERCDSMHHLHVI